MNDSIFQYIVNNIGVGNLLQTLVFYLILFMMLHIVLVQTDYTPFKWFVQKSLGNPIED